MSATLWPQVVDALVDKMRAQPGYRSPYEDESYGEAGVLVVDGPEALLTADGAGVYLIVGGKFDSGPGDDIGEAGQRFGPMDRATQPRDDVGEIVCQAVAQSAALEFPDPGMPTVQRDTMRHLRAEAFAVVDAVDAALRLDVTLGFTTRRFVAKLAETRLQPSQFQTENGGAVCAVTFRVSYTARI